MYKVLIVDDQPVILSGLSQIIPWEEYGLQIAGLAANGEEALGMLEREEIHILISDIKMPKMDGLELIANAKQRIPYLKCVVLSGYDDFQYVKEAAKLGIENYLLKPVDTAELVSTLTSILQKLESDIIGFLNGREGQNILLENTLSRLVNCSIPEEELLERLRLLGISTGYKSYTTVIIRPLGHTQRESKPDQLTELLYREIGYPVFGIPFPDADRDLITLFPDRPATDIPAEENLKQRLQHLHYTLKNELELDSFITAVSGTEELMGISRGYHDAKKLQEYSILGDLSNPVLFDHDLGIGQTKELLKINFLPLEASFAKLCREEVRSFLDGIFSSLGNKGLAPAAIRNTVLEILFCLSATAKKMRGYESTLFYQIKDLVKTMLHMNTLGQISQWLMDITLQSMEQLAAYETKYHPLVKKVLEHVAGHYQEDMNLKTLAYQFGVTPVYLGHLFLKETGEPFTNHLNTVRAEKAKILLKETSLSIKEISLSVGYANTKYFSSVFAKVTGVNPSEYRP